MKHTSRILLLLALLGAASLRAACITESIMGGADPAVICTNGYFYSLRTTGGDALINGTNVLAAEVHQSGTNSSDLSFDFELTAATAFSPAVLRASPGSSHLQLTWPAWAAGLTLLTAANLTPPVNWMPATNRAVLMNQEWRVSLPFAPGGSRFFRLQTP